MTVVIWVLFAVLSLLVLAGFAAVVAGRVQWDPMAQATQTVPPVGLPDQPNAEDVVGVRFDTALRGYRMDQVDSVLDALQERIAQLDAEVARLSGATAPAQEGPAEQEAVEEEPAETEPAETEPAEDPTEDPLGELRHDRLHD